MQLIQSRPTDFNGGMLHRIVLQEQNDSGVTGMKVWNENDRILVCPTLNMQDACLHMRHYICIKVRLWAVYLFFYFVQIVPLPGTITHSSLTLLTKTIILPPRGHHNKPRSVIPIMGWTYQTKTPHSTPRDYPSQASSVISLNLFLVLFSPSPYFHVFPRTQECQPAFLCRIITNGLLETYWTFWSLALVHFQLEHGE